MKNLFKDLAPIILILSMVFTMGIENIEQNGDPIESETIKQKVLEDSPKEELTEEIKEEPKPEEELENPKPKEKLESEQEKDDPKEEVKELKNPKPPKEVKEAEDKKEELDKEEIKKEEELEKLEDEELEELEEPEETKGSIKVTNKVQGLNKNDNKEFDIFISGSNGSLYTVSLRNGESIIIKNLEIAKYTISTIVPMNYGLVNIKNKNISITSEDLNKEATISYKLRNKSWFYSK